MNGIVMYGLTLITVIIVVVMLIRKMNIKVTLFAMGIVLMYIAITTGDPIAIKEFESAGLTVLDPLEAVIDQFKSTLPATGFITLILGGYPAYMTSIGTNEVAVRTPTKPIKKIKSVYILVPLVFLIGDVLSPVIPSVSNPVITLFATLCPILCQAGMSPLIEAAVVVTITAVMPTPLGGDSVVIVAELARYSAFAGMSVTDYTTQYHAMISVPTLIVMTIVYFLWQKFMDKKNTGKLEDNVEVHEVKAIPEGGLYRFVYALFPIFPILLLIVVYIIRSITGSNVDISVKVASPLSFPITIVCEIIRAKDSGKILKQAEDFFKEMGSSMLAVALLVATSIFILGLNSIGLIDALQAAILDVRGLGVGPVLPLILVGLTILIVLLSGSGIALFYAMAPLMVPLAEAAEISAITIPIPMGLCGNLMRAVSPVAATVVIVAGTIKTSPLDIIECISVPMIADVVTMFVLSMIMSL